MVSLLDRLTSPKEVSGVLRILDEEWRDFKLLDEIVKELKECAESGEKEKRQNAIKKFKKLKHGSFAEKAKNRFKELKRFERREQFVEPVSKLRKAASLMLELPIFGQYVKKRAKELLQQLTVFEAGVLYDTVKELEPLIDVKEVVVSDYPVIKRELPIDWPKVKSITEKIIGKIKHFVAVDKELRSLINDSVRGHKSEEERLKEEAWEQEKIAEEAQKARIKRILEEDVRAVARRIKRELSQAYISIGTQNPGEAIKYFEKALRINPRDSQSYFKMGVFWFLNDNIDKAIESFLKAVKYDRNNADAWYKLGLCRQLKFDYRKAIGCFFNAVRLNPVIKEGQAYIHLAESYELFGYADIKNDHTDRAINFLGRAILSYWDYISKIPQHQREDIRTRLSGSFFYRGVAYSKKGSNMLHSGRFEEAISFLNNAVYDFDEAASLGGYARESEVSALINRGIAWGSLGESKKAVEDFDRAIGMDSGNMLAQKLRRFTLEGGYRA